MRKLVDTELYNLLGNKKTEIQQAVQGKLNQNIGIISPDHIAPELASLKLAAKGRPLLNEAIALFEQFNGRIKLFNLGLSSSGMAPIPAYIPFLAAKARDRSKENVADMKNPTTQSIFMNMYRIGNWSSDEQSYKSLSINDLRACLETGVIFYKMQIEGRSKEVMENKVVLDSLTKVYTSLFTNAIRKTMNPYKNDFETDAASFIIAKFFLKYCVELADENAINQYSFNCIKHKATSLESLKSFESTRNIDYTKLSEFLKTFGEIFFNSPILLASFQENYLRMYGEGMFLAIEYIPFLIHFLFASQSGAVLGGSTRLGKRINELSRDLNKLYVAIINILR